jgi:HD-GYP domain-containing protein (c-di-GMP phosphodiesterase class II)
MPSNARQIETMRGDSLDASLYAEGDRPQLPSLSRGVVLTGLSRAFDLAEGRPPGHAQRVAYIATAVASTMGLSRRKLEDVFFASLLHDAGMAASNPASRERVADVASLVRRDGGTRVDARNWHNVAEALGEHCQAGARIARKLGLSDAVAAAIEGHHDTWTGFQLSETRSKANALVTGIVAAADRMESMIEHEGSPLLVRRHGKDLIETMAGGEVEPRIAETLARVANRDEFWLGLYDNDLADYLMVVDTTAPLSNGELMDFLGVISDVVDMRGCREPGRSRRVADLASSLAIACGLDDETAQMVHAAALLQDIGTFGVPVQYLTKPDILTVDEMTSMEMHPVHARDILSEIPGFGAAAWWVGCHHERVDGKGYPGMLEGDEVPLEAQIIGMAETFVALVSTRPYRPAMAPEDALEVVRGMCGTRFDDLLIPCLESALTDINLP